MLKPERQRALVAKLTAAFRRLCVETLIRASQNSTGVPAAFRRLCVETFPQLQITHHCVPAAFRRLCVETSPILASSSWPRPAAFRRLCVETRRRRRFHDPRSQPPSGGCVLKRDPSCRRFPPSTSRLQAAVC